MSIPFLLAGVSSALSWTLRRTGPTDILVSEPMLFSLQQDFMKITHENEIHNISVNGNACENGDQW